MKQKNRLAVGLQGLFPVSIRKGVPALKGGIILFEKLKGVAASPFNALLEPFESRADRSYVLPENPLEKIEQCKKILEELESFTAIYGNRVSMENKLQLEVCKAEMTAGLKDISLLEKSTFETLTGLQAVLQDEGDLDTEGRAFALKILLLNPY